MGRAKVWLILVVVGLCLALPEVAFACSYPSEPGETQAQFYARIFAPAIAQSQALWVLGVGTVLVLLWRKRRTGQPLGWYNLVLLAALVFHPAWTVEPRLGADCSVSTLTASIGVSMLVAIIVGAQFWRLSKLKPS